MTGGVAGMILAGGRSSRLGGGDKTLQEIGGRAMLAHVIERFSPQVERLALNANGDPARFAGFGLAVVADPLPDHPGPLAGMLAAMGWAANQGFAEVATVAGDTPFLPRNLVERLAAVRDREDAIAVAASAGRSHPVFALLPVLLRDDLRQFMESQESRKVADWLERHNLVTVEFGIADIGGRPLDPFFNVNTPGDLATAEAFARELSP